MFCNNCGKELSERAKFCPQCGVAADREEVSETEEVQQEETKTFADIMQETASPAVTIAEMEAEQGGAATTEKEEQPVNQPEEQPPEQVEAPASEGIIPETEENKPEKKSKKGIIIGAAAAVVVIGGAAAGYFCFSNEVMRFFMGDAGFAQVVEGKSLEYICGGELETDRIDAALADYVEQIFYGEEAASVTDTNSLTEQIFSVYGDSSIAMTAELDPGMLLSIIDTEGTFSNFSIETLIEAVQGDDCDRISYILTENGERVLGADSYLQGDKIAVLMPELTSQSFIVSTAQEETDETVKTERAEFDEAEMKRIREGLVNIYKNTVSEAEIEYTKSGTDLVLADCAVDSERVIICISAESFNGMVQEMSDFLKNDEYLSNYYVQATGEDISEYEKKFDENEYDSATQIIIENYYTDHAEVTGKKIILTDTDAESGKTFEMSFETTLGNCDLHMGDEEFYIDFTQRKTDEGCGKMEITFADAEKNIPFVLDVEYSGVGVAEYCGQSVNTGKYTIKVSEKDKFIDSILKGASSVDDEYDSDMMEETLPGTGMDLSSMASMLKNIVIEVNTECDGSSIASSFTLEIPMFFDIIFTSEITSLEAEKPVMPDCTDAIQLDDDFDMAEHEELQKEIYENLLKLADKSEIIGMIAEYAGIEDEIAKLSVSESFKVHYGAYSDEIRENADDVAGEIRTAFLSAIEKGSENITLDDNYIAYTYAYNSGEELKARFYFDENGEIKIIDDGGYYFVDFEKIREYMGKSECPKNLYAEFISGVLLEGGAVNIIYTDNPDDIPEVMPDMYNYMDGLYEWGNGNLNNEKDDFIIGTSEELAEGISVSERNTGDIETCNDISMVLAEEAMRFFELKGDNYFKESFVENGPESFCIVLSCSTGWGEPGTAYVNGEWTDADRLFNEPFSYTQRSFQDYLNRNGNKYYIDGAWCDILFLKKDGRYEVAGVVTIPSPDNYDEISLNYYDNADVLPTAEDLKNGTFGKWNYYDSAKPYKEGLFYYNGTSYTLGSYCVSTGMPLDADSTDDTDQESEDMNVCAQDMHLLISWLWDEYGLPYNSEMHSKEFIEMSVDFDSDKMAARFFYGEDGQLRVLDRGAFYFLDEQKLAAADTGFRNVYVEIHASDPLMSEFTVTAVSTENPDMLPSAMPDKFCFADGCFDWDSSGMKDGFRVGTYPVLTDGVSTLEQEIHSLIPDVETYNGYAETIGLAAEEFFGSKPQEFYINDSVTVLKLERTNGSWNIAGFAKDEKNMAVTELFAEDISAEFTALLNDKAADGRDIYAEIFVSSYYTVPHGLNETGSYMYAGEMRVAGVSVFPSKDIGGVSKYAIPSIVDYCDSFSYGWNSEHGNMPYISGIICGDSIIPCGTYCCSTGASLINKNAILEYHYPEG